MCSMDLYTHFETGVGSIGDCPAFGWKCVEDDVIGLSCWKMLGGFMRENKVFVFIRGRMAMD